MDIKITDLPLKTAPLGNADLFEVSESQGAGVFVSKKIAGNQLVGPQGPQGPQGVPGPVGPIGLLWQGSWSASGTYNINDAVGFGGASYFCINPVGPSVSNPATDTTNWALLAAQGATGPQGPQGIQGPAGASSSFAYEIGQYVPAKGGIIFHRWLSTTAFGVPESGIVQNYLVMDLSDLPGNQWGLSGTNVINAESRLNGSANTAAIVSTPGSSGFAASQCDTSTNGGQNDWYLPAIDELSIIFQNRFLINLNQGIVPGFMPVDPIYYWSSTEIFNTSAFSYYFLNGTEVNQLKTTNNRIRAVRRFSI